MVNSDDVYDDIRDESLKKKENILLFIVLKSKQEVIQFQKAYSHPKNPKSSTGGFDKQKRVVKMMKRPREKNNATNN
jgi:hypothetical protein